MIEARVILLRLAEYLGGVCAWVVVRFMPSKTTEREILQFLTNAPYWYSAQRLWSEKYAERVEGSVARSAEVERLLEMWRYLVTENKIEYVMRRLWRRGILQRVRSTPKYYRIKAGLAVHS